MSDDNLVEILEALANNPAMPGVVSVHPSLLARAAAMIRLQRGDAKPLAERFNSGRVT